MSIGLFIGVWVGFFIGLVGRKAWSWVFRDTARILPVLKVSNISAVALHPSLSVLAAIDGYYTDSPHGVRYNCELTKEQAEKLRDLLSDQLHNLNIWRSYQEI